MKNDDTSVADLDFLRQGATSAELTTIERLSPAVIATEEEDKDVIYARESIRSTIAIGLDSLRNVNELAKGTDDPRAFRVVPALIAAISASAEALLKTKNPPQREQNSPAAGGGKTGEQAPSVNLYFEGSPSDIQRKRNQKNIIIDGEFEED